MKEIVNIKYCLKNFACLIAVLLMAASASGAQPVSHDQALKNLDKALKDQKQAMDERAQAEKQATEAKKLSELAQWSTTLPEDAIMNYALTHGYTVDSYYAMANGVIKHDKDAEGQWVYILENLRYDMMMQSARRMKYGY